MTEAKRITLKMSKAIRDVNSVILDIKDMPYTSNAKRLLIAHTMTELQRMQEMLRSAEVYRG